MSRPQPQRACCSNKRTSRPQPQRAGCSLEASEHQQLGALTPTGHLPDTCRYNKETKKTTWKCPPDARTTDNLPISMWGGKPVRSFFVAARRRFIYDTKRHNFELCNFARNAVCGKCGSVQECPRNQKPNRRRPTVYGRTGKRADGTLRAAPPSKRGAPAGSVGDGTDEQGRPKRTNHYGLERAEDRNARLAAQAS